MAGSLGRGEWRFEHRDRVGVLLGSVEFGVSGWEADGNRRVDRYSEATLTVSAGCCTSLARSTFGQEIWFYRDDHVYPAWIGVIRRRSVNTGTPDDVVLSLADRSWWWTGRPVIFYVGPSGELGGANVGETPDVTVVAQQIVDIGDQVVPVGLVMNVPSGIGSSGVSAVPRISPRLLDTVYDAMTELGDTLVDWTVVGGTLFLDAPELPWSPILFDLGSSWTDSVEIIESGEGFATQVSVSGDNDALVSFPSNLSGLTVDPVRGFYWFGFDGGSQNDGQGVLSNIALNEWDRSHNPTVQIAASNVALSCDALVEFNELLPGRRCFVDTGGVCGFPGRIEARIAEVQWSVVDGVDDRIGVDVETLGATK